MKTLLTAAVLAGATSLTMAADVNPDVIFGSGNDNGSFTIATGSNVELGLRAKVRYNASNSPENTFNFDGVDTYTMQPGSPNGSPAPVWAQGDNARWNFEWSINTNVNGMGSNNLNDFTYQIAMFKLGADGTNINDAIAFDPINTIWADHSFGDNMTGNGNGTEAGFIAPGVPDVVAYAGLIANNNVAQNSWNYGFFDGNPGTALENFDFNAPGTYIVRLSAFDLSGSMVASDTVNINIVPVPSAVFAGLGMLGMIAGVRTIRRR